MKRITIRRHLLKYLQLFADRDCQYDDRENRDVLALKERLYTPAKSLERIKSKKK